MQAPFMTLLSQRTACSQTSSDSAVSSTLHLTVLVIKSLSVFVIKLQIKLNWDLNASVGFKPVARMCEWVLWQENHFELQSRLSHKPGRPFDLNLMSNSAEKLAIIVFRLSTLSLSLEAPAMHVAENNKKRIWRWHREGSMEPLYRCTVATTNTEGARVEQVVV